MVDIWFTYLNSVDETILHESIHHITTIDDTEDSAYKKPINISKIWKSKLKRKFE